MLGIEIAQPTVARYGKFPETALTGSRRSSQSAARIAFIRIYSGLDHAVQASLRSNAFFPVGCRHKAEPWSTPLPTAPLAFVHTSPLPNTPSVRGGYPRSFGKRNPRLGPVSTQRLLEDLRACTIPP